MEHVVDATCSHGAIYTDKGAENGARTRLFRNCSGGQGVEWIYAVDHAGPNPRWYGFLATGGAHSVASLIQGGMPLEPYKG